MALSRYAGYKLEWIGRIRSKYGPYGSCPASDSALGAVTRPKSPNFAPVAPPTKRARGGRVTATVTARAGAVFDGSEPFASGTRAHDQKVASYGASYRVTMSINGMDLSCMDPWLNICRKSFKSPRVELEI